MSAVNPYAPPLAEVADVDDYAVEEQPVRTWSSRGRIGRLRYLAHMMGGYLVVGVLSFAVAFVLGFIGLPKAAAAVGYVFVAAYLWFFALKTIQRSHDMDWSGWTALIAFIPFIGLIWIFKGGSRGGNRFGGPAPANTLGVKILALAFPAIVVIGILAAVAIPAYSDYAKRAKAAQMK